MTDPYPAIVAATWRALPKARVAMFPGKDDVPNLTAAFDLSWVAHDLAWAPKRDIAP